MPCGSCDGVHDTLKYKIGDRMRVLSMMPHVLQWNPFGDIKVDRIGDVGHVVRVQLWDEIRATTYLVNFNEEEDGPWHLAPFDECQLRLIE